MLFTTAVNNALSRFSLHERGNALFPRQPAPMLVEKAATLFDDPAWTYEPKWDGFRMLATVSLLLDGEVIAINDKGRSDFEALQQRLRPRNGKLPGYLCYMVFDLLYVNGHSLLGRPLEERQAILWELQPALQGDTVKLTEGFPAGKAPRLMKACAMMGLEGVVMKRKASISRPGFRTSDWLRVPIRHKEEFVIGGYLPGPRQWRTLILGQYDREGKFVYAGFCGTGLSEDTRAVILEELKATHRKTCPFRTVPVLHDDFRELPDIPPQWVRPSMVVEVEYRQRLKDGLRHADLKGLRPDKKLGLIRRSLLSERGPFQL
jgi:bifunctional non-homologous end joining protein LigD